VVVSVAQPHEPSNRVSPLKNAFMLVAFIASSLRLPKPQIYHHDKPNAVPLRKL
jgi:hypothetical protein